MSNMRCDVCGHKSCMDGCCYDSFMRALKRQMLVASPKEGADAPRS